MAILGNVLLAKTYIATAAIAAFRIVKCGSNDGEVTQATASTEALFGVTGSIAAAAANDRVDVNRAGIVPVEFGGTVTRGAKLTADSNGKAVAAAPAQGVNAHIIGIAEVSASAGDIGLILLAPSIMQGA
jgi:hypothetical protein